MEESVILFSNSNEFVQDADLLQSKLGFVSAFELDTYVKTSFSVQNSQIILTGGYIQALNKDHLVDDAFVLYKLGLPNGQPLWKTEGMVEFDLEKGGLVTSNTVKMFLQGLPIVGIIFLALLTLILPPTVAKVMNVISMVGFVIVFLYYYRKVMKLLYKMIFGKGIKIEDIKIHFEKDSDVSNINPEYMKILKELQDQQNVSKIVLYQGNFYIKQQVQKTSRYDSLKSLFVSKFPSDAAVQLIIQSTVNFLINTSFISDFATKPGQPS